MKNFLTRVVEITAGVVVLAVILPSLGVGAPILLILVSVLTLLMLFYLATGSTMIAFRIREKRKKSSK